MTNYQAIWKGVWRVIQGLSISGGGQWVEIHASPGLHPEDTLRRFSYLKQRGIRCYLRNLRSLPFRGSIGNPGMQSLRVHKDDLAKAQYLLSQMRD